ncbi:MAG: MCP four helix bundle domain-containing protein [Fimbriimonadaceae bacterium]|nr:MCP four helix bundle domain-containing protein [Fimbriimonadaceae bacterium]
MKNLSIRTKLSLIAGMLAVMTIALTFMALNGLGQVNSTLSNTNTNSQALRNHLEGDMMHDALRGDVLFAMFNADTSGDKNRDAVMADLNEHTANFKEMIAANEKLALGSNIESQLREAKPALDAYIASANQMVSLAFQDNKAAKAQFPAFMEKFSELEEKLGSLSDLIVAANDQATKASHGVAAKARNTMVIFAVIAFCAILAFTMSISKGITSGIKSVQEALGALADGDLTARATVSSRDELGQMAESFNSSSQALSEVVHKATSMARTVAGLSDDFQRAAIRTAEDAETTSRLLGNVSSNVSAEFTEIQKMDESIQQMTLASSEVAASAEQTARSATNGCEQIQAVTESARQVEQRVTAVDKSAMEATELGKDSTEALHSAQEAMATIREETARVGEEVKELAKMSSQVGEIVRAIQEIAEQTNLLALNAAIEAARAGEHGRGFAVVADEVRKLAERSAASTTEIQTIIDQTQQRTASVTKVIERAGEAVDEGAKLSDGAFASVSKIIESIGEIATQASAAAEASETIRTMVDATFGEIQAIAAVAEESSACSEEMAASAAEVRHITEQILRFSQQNTSAASEASSVTQEQTSRMIELREGAQQLDAAANELRSLLARFRISGSTDRSESVLRLAA